MSETETRSPAASLGLLDATMVGVGAMIGAGIFVLTGLAADTAGPAAILVFAPNFVEFVHIYWEGLPDLPVVYALSAVALFVGSSSA